MAKEVDVDGTVVKRLVKSVKMVRGIWYCDGEPFRRWMPATKDGPSWVGHDTGEVIHGVDGIVEMSAIDELVKRSN